MNPGYLTKVCISPGADLEKLAEEAGIKFNLTLKSGDRVSAKYCPLFGLGIAIESQNEKAEKWEIALKKTCILLPHLNLAVIVDKRFYNIPQAGKRLRGLGYVPVQRTISSLKSDGGDEFIYHMHESILDAIRSKKHPGKKAVDSRLTEIICNVSSNISPTLFTFGTFVPCVENDYDREEFHDRSPVLQFYRLRPREVEQKMEEICSDLPISRAVGLTSKVLKVGNEMHIPMIDFECDLDIVRSIVQKQNLQGAIVASGNSYHFYGFKLLSHEQNINFLNSLKPIGGVDAGWVYYQLKRGYSNLRITPAFGKFSQPCFVENI